MCLLHWKSFEAAKTTVFERIIASMFSTVKVNITNHLILQFSLSSFSIHDSQKTHGFTAMWSTLNQLIVVYGVKLHALANATKNMN
jgi:hypothetical protein